MSATLKMLPAALDAADRQPARRGPKDLIVPTRLRDRKTLEDALDAAGVKHIYEREGVWVETTDEKLFFAFFKEGSTFEGHFTHDTPQQRAEEMIQVVTHEYQRIVQQRVYERVLAQSESKGMVFKSEVVTDDNAIVVTLEVME